MLRTFILLFLLQFHLSVVAQKRPTIGVTLSGGGAKGLAHIGILKAIDSAGLRVNYVTGTSMGAIIGGLYAVGYSGDSIEKMARAIDWDLLLSNQYALRSLFMEEKEEYAKYDIELPWVRNRFKISTGFLEAQELWLKLSEMFYPVYQQKYFSEFNIPFRAIATDVGNGEAVVLKDGEIVSALRASMSIPSVFTATEHNGKILVDGGISRNFPVRDVKEMGADFVIGSTVATGLLPSDKVRNLVQLLLQIAFFREAEDNKKEVPLCDIYIPFTLDDYNMGSFGDADKILKAGNTRGQQLYQRFKHIKDSLDAIYGPDSIALHRLPEVKKILVSGYEVNGLVNTSRPFFTNTMNLKLQHQYTVQQLNDMVRQAFGTRYYSRIVYFLKPQADGSTRLIFNVEENPLTYLKAGIHYNRFTGIGIVTNITSRNFLLPNSRSMVALNIGESFRAKAEHLQYIGRLKQLGLTVRAQFDRFDFTTYEQFKQTGLYKQYLWDLSQRLHYSPSRNFTVGVGHKFEWLRYRPTITGTVEFSGHSGFSTLFSYLKHNTLDRSIFPRRGLRIDLEAGRVLKQDANLTVLVNGQIPADPDSSRIDTDPYYRAWLNAEGYLPFGHRTTSFLQYQQGINFNYKRHALNEFVVGGMTRMFRNQVTFAGVQEGALYTPSVATLGGGIRQQLFTGAYLTARANVMLTNLFSQSRLLDIDDFYSGYALTFSYNFALGPLDLSVMYCDQTQKIQTYINLGIPF